MSRKILLIGGGGHCRSVIDSLLELSIYSEIEIIDRYENIGNHVIGIPIIGCDDDLLALFKDGYRETFVTVGSTGDTTTRIKLFKMLHDIGYDITSIIDATAKVSKNVVIESGVFIGKNSVVNTGSIIRKGAIINSGSIIEHDCQIGAFTHIAPGAVLCGDVVVGDYTHIGANATIKQQVHIGSNSIIGMGSVVLHDIECNATAYGNPCKEAIKS